MKVSCFQSKRAPNATGSVASTRERFSCPWSSRQFSTKAATSQQQRNVVFRATTERTTAASEVNETNPTGTVISKAQTNQHTNKTANNCRITTHILLYLLIFLLSEIGLDTTADCQNLSVVEVEIVYDGPFCHHYGGRVAAEQRIADIVRQASTYYEVAGLCTTLNLVKVSLNGRCKPPPFWRPVGKETSDRMLDKFKTKENSKYLRILKRQHVTHLFTGKLNDNDPIVGTAWANEFASQNAYGVERMLVFDRMFGLESLEKFDILQAQARLFAHELAHNAGVVDHDEDDGTGTIMQPRITNSELYSPIGFSERSKKQMRKYLSMQMLEKIHGSDTAFERLSS